jgi:aspartate aminotransferase
MTAAFTFEPSDRVRRIKPSPSVAAAARARELKAAGRDIVDLTVGEPDFDTPQHVKDAAMAAIAAGATKYTAVNGTPALRGAISGWYRRLVGRACDDARITIGGGAKQVIFLALMASIGAGDEVIVPAPFWVSYPDMVLANEGTPILLPCGQETGFKIDPTALEAAITPKTRWLVFNAPGNPAGAGYSRSELAAILEVVARHPRVMVLADEIYDSIWFGEAPFVSIASVDPSMADRILLVNGVSKSHAMTGWRMGWGIGAPDLVKAINTLQSQMSSCPSSISQAATVAALNGPDDFVRTCTAEYRRRRDIVVDRLRAIPGLECVSPSGAFYLFPRCAGLIGKRTPAGVVIADDLDFVRYLLDAEGVATVHGGAYGLSPHFRLSFATSQAVLDEACTRIARACRALT